MPSGGQSFSPTTSHYTERSDMASVLPAPPNTIIQHFGELPDGRCVELSTLRNRTGTAVEIVSYGGIIKTISVPNRAANHDNVVLGFDNLSDYVGRNPYFGAIIGRFANRIARGRFAIDGVEYQLAVNEPPNNLHGGPQGFDAKLWEIEACDEEAWRGVKLHHVSADNDQGFPGTLDVTVRYRLSNDADTLRIDYEATTDRPTVVNLTNHSYFNLAGEGSGSVTGHSLELNASYYLPLDANLLPTGEFAPVANTPMDFTTPHAIGERLRKATQQLLRGKGYDHNYVLDRPRPDGLAFAARAIDPGSGRSLEVWTTEPGIDFYTGNFLDGSLAGPSGRIYRQSDGFALEPEHFSDSPNQAAFPSTVLRPGETYRSATEYRFGIAATH